MGLGQNIQNSRFQGVPGIYLLLLCDVIKQFGYRDEDIIHDMNVTRSDLIKPDARITLTMGHVAAQRGTAIAGHAGLGIAYAQALKVTLHGSVGLVALTSPTVGAALDAMSRFIALRAPFFKAQVITHQADAQLVLEPIPQMDTPIQTFMMEALLIGVSIMAEQLLGRKLVDSRVEMVMPEPGYYERFKNDLPIPVVYQQPLSCLRFPLHVYHARPQLADPAAAELAQQQCELEMQQLFREQETFSDKVQRYLSLQPNDKPLPDQDEIAQQFHISTRTLKRRLQENGDSFRALIEAELKRRALKLLRETQQDISEIAYQLGYRNVGNFSTAFKRWTGETPRKYRSKI